MNIGVITLMGLHGSLGKFIADSFKEDADAKTALYVGRLEDHKNVDLGIHALEMLILFAIGRN